MDGQLIARECAEAGATGRFEFPWLGLMMIDRARLSKCPLLTTKTLLLRRPTEGDVGAIVEGVGDWDVARRLSRVPHPYGSVDARFFLEHVVPNEWVWAITIRGADGFIGAVGLTPEEGTDSAELGYWLSRAYWNRGIVTEAASAVVSFGFETLHLSYITSGYFEENSASGRVLEKLGFSTTGRSIRPSLAAGSDMPSIEMRLSPERQAWSQSAFA